ncbi:hypothetical protein C8N27_0689 [Tenacibaculum discolor]|nr:hypothetical protein C8N27_0689 [Tenacibaculum discolor]
MSDLTFIKLQLLIQTIAAIVNFLYFKRYNRKFILLLLFIQVTSLLVEGIGYYYLYIGKSSFYCHYIYVIINFNLIAFLYFMLIRDTILLNVMKGLLILFNICWVFVMYNSSWLMYVFIFGAINTAISIFFYLRELLLSDRILNYKKLLPFWVSVGFLVFYLPSIPFFSMLNYMKTRGLFFILNILIILMNLIIVYGLICSKKEVKY